MMSDVKREMEIMSCRQDLLANECKERALVPLSHQSLNGAENC